MSCTPRTPHFGSLPTATPHKDAHSSSASEWTSGHHTHVREPLLVRPYPNTLRSTLVFASALASLTFRFRMDSPLVPIVAQMDPGSSEKLLLREADRNSWLMLPHVVDEPEYRPLFICSSGRSLSNVFVYFFTLFQLVQSPSQLCSLSLHVLTFCECKRVSFLVAPAWHLFQFRPLSSPGALVFRHRHHWRDCCRHLYHFRHQVLEQHEKVLAKANASWHHHSRTFKELWFTCQKVHHNLAFRFFVNCGTPAPFFSFELIHLTPADFWI